MEMYTIEILIVALGVLQIVNSFFLWKNKGVANPTHAIFTLIICLGLAFCVMYFAFKIGGLA